MRSFAVPVLILFTHFGASIVAARPMTSHSLIARDEQKTVNLDEHPLHRVSVVVMCLVYAVVLALAQGYRAGRMAGRKTKTGVSDILVFAQGFVCTAFVFAVGIEVAGLGLMTDGQCFNSIRVCIAMYGASKIALYLFLLERVHIVRAPFVDRIRDWIYVAGTILVVGGFAGLMGWQFVNPTAQLSREDGECRIGIERGAAISIIVLDTIINFVLTIVFVWQLWPAMKPVAPSLFQTNDTNSPKRRKSVQGLLEWKKETRELIRTSSRSSLGVMLFRNVLGSSFLLATTVITIGLFINWGWAKLSHACLLIFLTDVVLGMFVTQWLTMRSAEEEAALVRPHFDTPRMSTSGFGSTSALFQSTTPGRIHHEGRCCVCVNEKAVPISYMLSGFDDDIIRFNLH